jgi:predicted DNA-binding transcriptional regulator AlpA
MTMQAKTWRVLEQALEAGFGFGVRRFFKYRDSPICNEADLRLGLDTFVQAQMNEIADWFDFPEPGDEGVDPWRELRRQAPSLPQQSPMPKQAEKTEPEFARQMYAPWVPETSPALDVPPTEALKSKLGRGTGCPRQRVRPQMPGIVDIRRVGHIIGMSPTSVRRLMKRTDLQFPFPPGRLLSAHKRIWIEQDVIDWLNRMTTPENLPVKLDF